MNKVLVTGSEGLIGREVVSLLRENGLDVFTIDLLGHGPQHTILDITSQDVKNYFNSVKPDIVIHLAAQVDVTSSFNDPIADLQINVLGTIHLLLAAKDSGVRQFIFVGSGGAIYDSNCDMPITELDKIRTVSPYGVSKFAAESYVRILCEKFGMNWVSLALSNCYGSVETHNRGVIFSFYRALKEYRPAEINGVSVTRDFVHVSDVASAIYLSVGKVLNCRLNISSNTETSLLQLYEEIAAILGVHVKPQIFSPRVGDVLQSRLDNSLAKEKIGWSPKISVNHGLRMSLTNKNGSS